MPAKPITSSHISRRDFNSLLLASMAATLSGCYHNKALQRSQMIVVPESVLLALSYDSWNQITYQIPPSRNTRHNKLVERVGSKIAAASGQPDVDWEFRVLEHQVPNAFVLPGGKVAFHSGILPLMDNEAQVAAVMGHEVGHVAGRHAQERLSQQLALNGLVMLASYLATGQMDEDTHRLIFAALGAGVTYGLLLPYSRQHEYEADNLGLQYMAHSGYDPQDAGNFWRNMMRYSGYRQSPLEFMSTHPSDASRLAVIDKLAPQLQPIYAQKRDSTRI